MAKTIIHTTKHIVQMPFSQITTGTAENIFLAVAKNVVDVNTATEVQEGTIIDTIYIEIWLQNSANDGHQVLILEKLEQNGIGATFAELAALYSYDNKKNILFTHEGLSSNDGVGNPQNILRQWIKIPKGKQRFGLGDVLKLSISNPSSNSLNRCGFALYKEKS